MSRKDKTLGVQQVLIHAGSDTRSLLTYVCQQSAKVYNTGVYYARQVFFKTGKILDKKFDLLYEPTVASSLTAQSLPSTPMQQTLMSVAEAFKGFKALRELYLSGQLSFKPKAPDYLEGSKLFKVAYPNCGA